MRDTLPVVTFALLLHLVYAKTYILSFASYKPPAQHALLVSSLLHLIPKSEYHLLPRPPTPTDFLLLETPHSSLLTLLRHPEIRHITHDRQTRHPLALTPPSNDYHSHARAFVTPSPTPLADSPIRVAIFDTGISPIIPVASAHDWTPENTTLDKVGHGTFVASLLTSANPACPGLAPNAELHIFRVFTAQQISYTSWFLDAFNYALHTGIKILNLSIGGPDFADAPFVDKVNELTAHGIIVISAIGNDGPLWGTLNNPADMMDVIGVGGYHDNGVATFSSRGMTTHDLPDGYGRVKPDILARARALQAQAVNGRCTRLSGTSVASPVVAAAVVRLISAIEPQKRHLANPASVKRALLVGGKLVHGSMYEQGAGLIHLPDSVAEMRKIVKEHEVSGAKAVAFPGFYDLRAEGCPYMWPHCAQPLFYGQLPTVLNVTLLNPHGVEGRVTEVVWKGGMNAELLEVLISKPQRFWPWAGGMGIHLTVVREPEKLTSVEGVLSVTIVSVHEENESFVQIPIMADVIPSPPREKRLLWDVFHSIRYPPGYVPTDSLADKKDMLDWLGDHPYTNLHKLFRTLRREGYYVDILDRSLECLQTAKAQQYGGILLFDSEDFFSKGEITIVRDLVKNHGTALIVAAEWYNMDIMREIRFQDDNTRSWWTPVVAGANVPALNELLLGFGVAFGEAVVSGDVTAGQQTFRFESGVPLVMFPPRGQVLHASKLSQDADRKRDKERQPDNNSQAPVLGIAAAGQGAVLVYGDTHCIDTIYTGARCYDFFVQSIQHAIDNCTGDRACPRMHASFRVLKHGLSPASTPLRRLARPLTKDIFDVFRPHSRVLNRSFPTCTRHKLHRAVQVHLDGRLSLPLRKTVNPTLAERSYLGDLSGLSDIVPNVRAGFGRELLSRYSITWVTAIHVRGIVSILVGFSLIAASFSMHSPSHSKERKKRPLGKQLRRSCLELSSGSTGSCGIRIGDLSSYSFSRFLSITNSED